MRPIPVLYLRHSNGQASKRAGVAVALLFVALAMFFSQCRSTPGWIHRLPDETPSVAPNGLQFSGAWARDVKSRYSVGDPESESAGRELIRITEDRYEKIHVHSETVHGVGRRVAYIEKGHVAVRGSVALLTPIEAMYWEEEELQAPSIPPLPNTNDIDLSSVGTPPPLLYHLGYDSDGRAVLTPFAAERLGELFPGGIYEGSQNDYDVTSDSFRAVFLLWVEKRFHSHGYFRLSRQSER